MTQLAEPRGPTGLYAITPDWADTLRLLWATERILKAGCRWLQYRNKLADKALKRAQCLALRALTQRYGARLIVNDDLVLARAIEADGVHLGQDDGDLAHARAQLRAGRLLGASCYQSLDRARAAVTDGADYVAFGSVFPSQSKPHAAPAELSLIRLARRILPVPIVAIGGITPDNAAVVVRVGADAVAVISALYGAEDPFLPALELLALFAEHRGHADLIGATDAEPTSLSTPE